MKRCIIVASIEGGSSNFTPSNGNSGGISNVFRVLENSEQTVIGSEAGKIWGLHCAEKFRTIAEEPHVFPAKLISKI